ncbi:chitin deacetylase 7-like isoform X3 [Octopus vulgaris]|uniref:Chitin deacetylase 7-like isoform X3 n=1 Tax=Octopus vulgaris TaxID=6645 RepID=A0AA36F1G4_OCTVU|nr:chitin deacetylase 7-like isoform X3 [Octopus vulgaris]
MFTNAQTEKESCTEAGDYKCHETDDSKFYHCTGPKHGILQNCGKGLEFNPSLKVCVWPGVDYCKSQRDQSKTTNDVGATAKPPTKSVVTTHRVTFKRSSLLSKILSTTTSKPSTHPQTTSKPSTHPQTTKKPSTHPQTTKKPSTHPQTTKKPQLTGPCRPEYCKLPNCKCPGPEIPGSLSTYATPQIILLTFDDGVDEVNMAYYRQLFNSGITNPNGCPIKSTFFVSGDYTNYNSVKELYNNGHEIASHSITHKLPVSYWLNASRVVYTNEIVGMKQELCIRANIAENDIRGMRSPFLAMGKDAQFETLAEYGFSYDSSMVTGLVTSTAEESCTEAGDYKCHETDDSKFYHCTGPKHGILQNCGKGLEFNPSLKVCVWPGVDYCKSQRDQSKTTNDVGATAKPPTKSVVTTHRVTFKRSSLLSKILSTTTSKPSTHPQTTSKPSTHPQTTKKPSTHPQTTKKPQLTGPCRPEYCKLPNCKCPGPEIPGSLSTYATPQIILLTFDDGVDEVNMAYYRQLFNSGITNPNGCPIKSTFFVSGDYTNYNSVKELYNNGHEIASHSITHKLPVSYWLNASRVVYTNEIVGMKQELCIRANIAENDIRGMRSPFLAMGKDAQFETLAEYGFSYDSSMVTGLVTSTAEVPTWPFTLDYPVNKKYCTLKFCPEKSYPGLWEVPLTRWYNSRGSPCSMPDACRVSKKSREVLQFLRENFNRHYKRNKAPFGIFLHSPWLMNNLNPLKKFLKEVTRNKDVWIVTVSQALQWIQNPVPLNNITQFKSWKCT